jgi:ornithine lipid hydroxylase
VRTGARQGGGSLPDLDGAAADLRVELTPGGRWLRQSLWPLLVAGAAGILALGQSRGQPTLHFNLSYAWLIACLFVLERRLPYRRQWRETDGQLGPDLGHTLLSKGVVQLVLVSVLEASGGLPRVSTAASAWPLPAQVLLGLVVAEFGLYWVHRMAHEWPWWWRFHAVHHSVRRLWLVNTGRFHFVDSLDSVLAALLLMVLCGLSLEAIVWVSALTAYVGVLTHCNVDMRCGWLSGIFNTPNLHRLHHAAEEGLGNCNYGENLMLWDRLFGTFRDPSLGEVGSIGIREHMPAGFLAQLVVPFRWRRHQASWRAATTTPACRPPAPSRASD